MSKARKGKVTLFNNANTMLFAPTFIAAATGKKESYSWDNEDYRQSRVSSSIEGAIAKPEDFIAFPFRHISATIVGGWSWKATEFSDRVLKAAAALLSYKPACVNHSLETNNMIGLNGIAKYREPFKQDGIIIPGGLDAPIWIDGRLHQDITRKLSGFPVPHIQSVSVTVAYEWEPSHDFKDRNGETDDWEFENQIGRLVDGHMVRRVVTKIEDFYETSLVFLGADPFAKICNDKNELVQIEKAAIVGKQMFSKEPDSTKDHYKKTGHFYLSDDSLFGDEKSINLRERIVLQRTKKGNLKKTGMKHTLKLSGKKSDYKAELITELEENYNLEFVAVIEPAPDAEKIATLQKEHGQFSKDKTTAETNLKKAQDDLKDANDKVTEYETIIPHAELEAFKAEIPLAEVKAIAQFGNKVLKAKREEAARLYKLSVGEDKFSAAIEKQIKESTDEALEGYLKQYGSSCMEQFGGTCGDCGSTKVNFRSSKSEGEEGDKGGKKEDKHLAHQFRD